MDNYLIIDFYHACSEFEDSHFITTVKHCYYARDKLFVVERNKCAFKSCLTKYDLNCKNTNCDYYEDREPHF